MNNRIDRIYRLVEQHKYITPSLVAKAMFKFPAGRNKAQQIMGRMAKDKTLNRFRVGRGEYIYHVGPRSKKWRHWLNLTRFHFQLLGELKSWQRIVFWQNEVKYSYGVADGLYIVKLTLDGDCVIFFLEYDDGNNAFGKVQSYMAYYAGKSWRGEWWAAGQSAAGQSAANQPIQSFPLVLIVTPRAEEIRMMVAGVRGTVREGSEIFRVIGEGEGVMGAVTKREKEKAPCRAK